MQQQETVFVTGGTGYIGKYLVKHLLEQPEKYKIQLLVRTIPSNKQDQVEYVQGNLQEAQGAWTSKANAAHFVIHLAQPSMSNNDATDAAHITKFSKDKLFMDNNLYGALQNSANLKRLIYVSGLNWFGCSNGVMGDENSQFTRNLFGNMVELYTEVAMKKLQELPMILVFPGAVYGNGNWFVDEKHGMLNGIIKGQAVPIFDGKQHFMSVIHVLDAARAMVHFLNHGTVHEKYILVDTKPITTTEMCNVGRKHIKLSEVQPSHVPEWILKMFVTAVAMAFLKSDVMYSSKKLQDTGFQFKYATIETGLPAVLDEIGDAKYWQVRVKSNESLWNKFTSLF